MQSVNVAFMGCASFDQARKVYSVARAKLGEILSGMVLSSSSGPLPKRESYSVTVCPCASFYWRSVILFKLKLVECHFD